MSYFEKNDLKYFPKIDSNSINVSNLNAGVYILQINDGQKSITKKFIKE